MDKFEIKFKCGEKKEEVAFDKKFLEDCENLKKMEDADFNNLDKAIDNAYGRKGDIDYEKVKYYISELVFKSYTTSGEAYSRVGNYFKVKKNPVSDKEFGEYRDKLIKISSITKTCADKSVEWFNNRICNVLERFPDYTKERDGENDTIAHKDSEGIPQDYFWYQHKRHYKENPISLSVFLLKSGDIKVAIELHDTAARKTHIKELFIKKLNSVVSIINNPSEYGIKSGDFKELKYTTISSSSDAYKPGGIDGGKVTDLKVEEVGSLTDRIQFFFTVEANDGDSDEIIEDKIYTKMNCLWDLYQKIAYSSVYEREIYKNIHARGVMQIVFNGAPGTGKTYGVQEYVEEATMQSENDQEHDRWKMIQFHPSYDYTDFVEGIRPVSVIEKEGSEEKEVMTFVKLDGQFKAFCRSIVMKRLQKVKDYCETNSVGDEYCKDGNDARQTFEYIKRLAKREKESKKDSLIKLSDEERRVLDIFNAIDLNNEELYYFIIDEINRADISKVFGELMFTLEYRGISNRIPTQYTKLTTYEENDENADGKITYTPMTFDCFKDGFFIPENVVIIGTMNDIDKSVESFDFAMRRRFHWAQIKADEVMRDILLGMLCKGDEDRKDGTTYQKILDLESAINRMNKKLVIEGRDYGLTDDYHIGPCYFKNFDLSQIVNETTLENEFNLVIEPLLREYIRGRADENKVKKFIKECKAEFKKEKKKDNDVEDIGLNN